MTAGPRVLLIQLSERTSGRGNRYMSGRLGRASVVAFQAEEPDKYGNPVWECSSPHPSPGPRHGTWVAVARAGTRTPVALPPRPLRAPQDAATAGAAPPPAYRRQDHARRAPAADDGAFADEDGLDDLYR